MRHGLSKLSINQRANAATLYKFGWKLDSIAKHYGVHYGTVRRALQEMGLYHGLNRKPTASETYHFEQMVTAWRGSEYVSH
jgi:transposase